MSDDWNPNDPEATSVVYDLSDWTFDQQAELASDLAEAAIPHAWDETDLLVPPTHEPQADAIVDAVEARTGVVYRDADSGGDDAVLVADAVFVDDVVGPEPIALAEGVPAVEYELDEWPAVDRRALTRSLTQQSIPHRWEDDTLVVGAVHEAIVDALLDFIESGELSALVDVELDAQVDGAPDEQLPFETLTTFFLAGERLRRNPLDADGLEQLLAAIDVADPRRAPYGVDVRLWRRTCQLAEELADALAAEDQPDDDLVLSLAGELHDLLRPYV